VITRASTAAECSIETKPISDNVYAIDGCIKVNSPPCTIRMAVNDPRIYAKFVLHYLLKKNQIINKGKIQFQKMPLASPLLANETSSPLKSLIVTMQKESNNIIANALFKTMGNIYFHEMGSWENSKEALHNILYETIHLNFPKKTLIDGA